MGPNSGTPSTTLSAPNAPAATLKSRYSGTQFSKGWASWAESRRNGSTVALRGSRADDLNRPQVVCGRMRVRLNEEMQAQSSLVMMTPSLPNQSMPVLWRAGS